MEAGDERQERNDKCAPPFKSLALGWLVTFSSHFPGGQTKMKWRDMSTRDRIITCLVFVIGSSPFWFTLLILGLAIFVFMYAVVTSQFVIVGEP